MEASDDVRRTPEPQSAESREPPTLLLLQIMSLAPLRNAELSEILEPSCRRTISAENGGIGVFLGCRRRREYPDTCYTTGVIIACFASSIAAWGNDGAILMILFSHFAFGLETALAEEAFRAISTF